MLSSKSLKLLMPESSPNTKPVSFLASSTILFQASLAASPTSFHSGQSTVPSFLLPKINPPKEATPFLIPSQACVTYPFTSFHVGHFIFSPSVPKIAPPIVLAAPFMPLQRPFRISGAFLPIFTKAVPRPVTMDGINFAPVSIRNGRISAAVSRSASRPA